MWIVLLNGWVNLNEIHLRQLSANLFSQLQAITGCTWLIGRLIVGQIWTVALDVFLGGTKATSCQ